MTNDTRAAFEAYWRERQLRTHRYTDRPCPDDWGQAFKADAEAAWLASRRAALEGAIKVVNRWALAGHIGDQGISGEAIDAIRALAV